MSRVNRKKCAALASCVMTLTAMTVSAAAAADDSTTAAENQEAAGAPADRREAAAQKHVDDAAAVVRKMSGEPRIKELLHQAKGVVIVPTYGRAALGIGVSGGAGVLLVKRDGENWSEPIFYNLGGLSAGVQAGAEGGALALILNNDKAVNVFMRKNTFSLSADSGLAVVNWSKLAQGSVGIGDITAWGETKGLFGNVLSIAINDIRFNQNLTDAYYHLNLSPTDVISGRVKSARSDILRQSLATTPSPRTSGSSASGTESTGKPGSGN